MKWPLKNETISIVPIGSVGDFAFRRSFYHHSGIDIYCNLDQEVIAIEDGIVVGFNNFTGVSAYPPSPWWNDTYSIMVEGASGVIGYCELYIEDYLDIGMEVRAGDTIGTITPVLKKDKGNGITMLHLEQYVIGTKEHVTWILDTPQPAQLFNPRFLLEKIINKTFNSLQNNV